MTTRSTDQERVFRERVALEYLSDGAGSAYAAKHLADRFNVSLRQARRYVSAASFELVNACTPAELDRQMMLAIHRLDLIAGRAMSQGDRELAVKATQAGCAALSQFRRAISAPLTRFRLPSQTHVEDIPF